MFKANLPFFQREKKNASPTLAEEDFALEKIGEEKKERHRGMKLPNKAKRLSHTFKAPTSPN